jgi:hypothetical protein
MKFYSPSPASIPAILQLAVNKRSTGGLIGRCSGLFHPNFGFANRISGRPLFLRRSEKKERVPSYSLSRSPSLVTSGLL